MCDLITQCQLLRETQPDSQDTNMPKRLVTKMIYDLRALVSAY